jgi:hypothetical protein
MKTQQVAVIAVLAGLLLFSTPILAHHGYAAYDMTANRSMKGTITNFTMANPHSQISFDVKDASGNVEHWTVEPGAPVRGMKAGGFDFDSLKPGDMVTINFHPGKGTVHVGVLSSVEFPDGRVLPHRQGPGIEAPNN